MRFRTRLRKAFFWGVFFSTACLTGVIGFAVWYINGKDMLANVITAEIPRYLPTSRMNLRHAKIRVLGGEIELKEAHVLQKIDGASFPILRLPWLRIRFDPRMLLKRQFVPRNV